MTEFGDTDPPIKHNDDDDDDDGDNINPFQPSSSPPGPSGEDIRLTMMNREREKGPSTAETSFIEENPAVSRVLASNEEAWDSLTGVFPEAKATELEASYSKTGRLQVKMSGQGKKTYNLYTEDRQTGKQGLNPNLTKEIKKCSWYRE